MGLRIAEVTAADMSVRFLLLDRILYFEKAGHDVTAIFSSGPYTDDLRQSGLRIQPVPMRREISPLQDLLTLIRLVSIFRRERFDVVFSHTPKPGLLVPLAARIARLPLIIHTVHGLLFHDRMPRRRAVAAHLAERFTAFCCHHLFFVSAEDVRVAKRLLLKRPSRLFYMGNGIDTARFHPPSPDARRNAREALGIPAETYVVGTVGRLVWEKGYKELLEAADLLAASHPNILFLIVGPLEPDQSDALRQPDIARIRDLPHVRWLGEIDDVWPLYAAMNLFLLPSHREGTPLTVMEAAASGVPVIATDIRGCREVVVHGKTGLLFPMGDVKLLVAAIKQLLHAPDEASQMGAAGRRFILSRFDQESVFDRLTFKLQQLTSETRDLQGVDTATRPGPSIQVTRPAQQMPPGLSSPVGNALTIDLEDWRQLVRWKMTGESSRPEQALINEMERLLCLLSHHGTRATFFVLANVAQAYPDLIRRLAEAGHEIASHGWSHRRVYTQSPQAFRTETLQSKELLEQIVQQSVVGYRAAEFSITSASWWALQLLAELGFEYDSSIYPVASKRYGVPGFDPNPSTLSLGTNSLREVPPTTLAWAGRRWPIAGGTTFALVPHRVIDKTIRAHNSQGRPAILYFHPYEFSSERLRPPTGQACPSRVPVALRHSVPHNFARKQIPHRLRRLLTDFRFGPVKELFDD